MTQGIVLLSQVTKEQRMDLLRVYFKVGREYWFTPGILHSRKGVNQTMLIGGSIGLHWVYRKPNYVDGGSIGLVYSGYTVNQTIGRWVEYWFTPGIP